MKGKSLISLSYIFILNITIFLVISGFYIPNALAFVITVNMNLPAGSSMISLPVIPFFPKLSNIFPSAVVVYEYQKGEYNLVTSEEELEVARGYLILLNEETSFTLTGDPIYSYILPLSENGWYLIGGCTSPARASIYNGNIVAIYRYVPGIGYQQVLDTEFLQPGRGYWILVNNILDQAFLEVSILE